MGILSPKSQFSKTVKTNFNLMVKPKSLITTHFFFFFFNVLKSLFLPVSEHLMKLVNGSKRIHVHEDTSYMCM